MNLFSPPNQLNITINTSVPGVQKIKYTPSMTDKSAGKETAVLFNPLVKLTQSKLNQIPEDLRKKGFFNAGLFESMLRHIQSKPYKSIEEATYNGIVDNNIQITLQTLFPEKSVIYLNDKPYTIAAHKWTIGDWKIDTKKKKEEIDLNKITDPILYQQLVKDEIKQGEEQLKDLPSTIVYGPNYEQVQQQQPSSNQTSLIVPQQISPPLEPYREPPTKVLKEITEEPAPNPVLLIEPPQQSPPPKQPLLLTNGYVDSANINNDDRVVELPNEMPIKDANNNKNKDNGNVLDEDSTGLTTMPEVIQPTNKLIISKNSNAFLRQYFGSKSYYYMLNALYYYATDSVKTAMQQFLSKMTLVNLKSDTKNISSSAYKDNVNGLEVIANKGGGDCFFIAVADSINMHNYYNQNSRIISGMYGKSTNLFTPKYLRSLVYSYLTTLNLNELASSIGTANATELNNKFKTAIEMLPNINETEYISLANNIYINNDNFLIKPVDRIPIYVEKYNEPFEVIQTEEAFKNYILSSNYWANQFAIDAIRIKLKLNIISIEKTRKGYLQIPYVDLKTDNYSKYLFLYYDNNHYEAIHFNYKSKEPKMDEHGNITGIKMVSKKMALFKKTDIPPIYIFFLLYGSYYSTLDESSQRKVTFYKNQFALIDTIINNVIYKVSIYQKYYRVFKEYFPNSTIKPPQTQTQAQSNSALNVFQGGGNDISANALMKPDDKSKLAYYIDIELQIYPGDKIPPNQLKKLKCTQKLNAIRKSWADLTGATYTIKPNYSFYQERKNDIKGGKHNKTRKLRRILK
jgi:hypothetical protein